MQMAEIIVLCVGWGVFVFFKWDLLAVLVQQPYIEEGFGWMCPMAQIRGNFEKLQAPGGTE